MSEKPAARHRGLKPGLAFRLAIVLSLAMLPLGLISVFQTLKVLEERRALSETALLDHTQQAVSDTRELIRSAVSSARTLAIAVEAFSASNQSCDLIMSQVVNTSEVYSFAGFIDSNLRLVCASNGERQDLANLDIIRSDLENREPGVIVQPLEFVGPGSAVIVTVPVTDSSLQSGTAWIAIPLGEINDVLAEIDSDVDLVVFQREGDIIATGDFTDDRRSVLPAGRSLPDLVGEGRQTFRDLNRQGNPRHFAVVPIVEGSVFALGSWRPRSQSTFLPGYEEAISLYVPLLMWVIAIAVAYIGVHRLAIRHVWRLRSWMRLFAAGRTDLDAARLDNAPEEFEVLADAFRAMTRRISEQERRRDEDLKEKTVLLREIHHRVKNNLQLISSIMNMQIRNTESPEARHLLRRVQDRVMALSAIHRYLYLARKLSKVRADSLLEDIIRQLVTIGALDEYEHRIEISTSFDAVEIDPDQSVPLSLLATEAAINAVKHSGVERGATAWINIALKQVGADTLNLSIVNSRMPHDGEDDTHDTDGSGLGSRLIQSFVSQLDGTLDTHATPDRYELHVTFPLSWPEVEEDEALPAK
ncbi:MAG: histidine kinase dimerization/phosphoacceptor domain -containing protein [Roseovarius sp.]